MSALDRDGLAEALAVRIEAVPGVRVLHPPRPRPGTAADLLAGRRVAVLEHDDALDVAVSVGIDADAAAKEVAAAVHEAVLAVLAAEGRAAGDITVRIASIV
jgi:hypothetical protein